MKKFTKEHEWVELIGDVATIGITDYAQHQLGDVVYVELPKVGKTIKSGQEVAVVESVKAASDIYAPLDGNVCEVNEALQAQPDLVNQSAETSGWFFKMTISDKSAYDGLLSADEYAQLIS